MKSCIEGYKKITKRRARELFSKGERIFFLPSMANPFSPWSGLGEFPMMGDFANVLNVILKYQPKQLGKTVNFYIPL